MNVSIVGFGYVGLTLGCVLANRGHQVVGIDTNEHLIRQLNTAVLSIYEPGLESLFQKCYQNQKLTMTTDFSVISQSEIVIITVGTPLNDKAKADLTSIKSCIACIQPYLKNNHIIILKSTIPPGTTETLISNDLIEQFNLKIAFCPERLAEGQALQDLERLPIIIGGINSESAEKVAQFWKTGCNVQTLCVSNAKTAEMIKLASNLWIDVNIALANELAQLCFQMDVDVIELIDAANTLPKGDHHVNFLCPSIGVGGSCLTKDPWFMVALAKAQGIDLKIPALCRRINDEMPAYTSTLIDRYFKTKERESAKTKIAILGLAFKSDTNDTRSSPVIPIVEKLKSFGYQIAVHDPLVGIGNLSDVLMKADAVAFFTGHKEFKEFSLERISEQVKPGALIFDGRMYFSKDSIEQIRELGLDYLGVGRMLLQGGDEKYPIIKTKKALLAC